MRKKKWLLALLILITTIGICTWKNYLDIDAATLPTITWATSSASRTVSNWDGTFDLSCQIQTNFFDATNAGFIDVNYTTSANNDPVGGNSSCSVVLKAINASGGVVATSSTVTGFGAHVLNIDLTSVNESVYIVVYASMSGYRATCYLSGGTFNVYACGQLPNISWAQTSDSRSPGDWHGSYTLTPTISSNQFDATYVSKIYVGFSTGQSNNNEGGSSYGSTVVYLYSVSGTLLAQASSTSTYSTITIDATNITGTCYMVMTAYWYGVYRQFPWLSLVSSSFDTLPQFEVNHYLQNLDGTYRLDGKNASYIKLNETFSPEPRTYNGYTTPERQSMVITGAINKIDYYYNLEHYTISFDGNGATSGLLSQIPITYTETKTLPANPYSRDGHDFLYFTTNQDGTGDQYAPGAQITLASSVTLYAQWQIHNYTVTLNANGGNCATASLSRDWKTEYGELPEPTREGYLFAGWFEEADTHTTYTTRRFNSDRVTYSHTLYARWVKPSAVNDVTYRNKKYDDIVITLTDDLGNEVEPAHNFNIAYGDETHDNTNAGTGLITITGIEDNAYTGNEIIINFNIAKRKISISDIEFKNTDKEITIYKDGTWEEVTYLNRTDPKEVIHPHVQFEDCQNLCVDLNFESAYISYANGTPIYRPNLTKKEDGYNCLTVKKLISENSNFVLVNDSGEEVSYLDHTFENFTRLIDNTTPSVESITILGDKKQYRLKDVEFEIKLSEEVNVNSETYDSVFKNNYKVDYKAGNVDASALFSGYKIIEDPVTEEKYSVLRFKNTFPGSDNLPDNKIFNISNPKLVKISGKDITDIAGNVLPLTFSSSVWADNFDGYHIDTNRYEIEIAKTPNVATTDEYIIKFDIDIKSVLSTTLNKDSIIEKFALTDGDGFDHYLDHTIDGVTITEVTPREKYSISVDTRVFNKVGKTETDGKDLKLSIDSVQIVDINNNNNKEAECSIRVKRTNNHNEIEYRLNEGQRRDQELTLDISKKYFVNTETNKEMKFYKDDVISIKAINGHDYISLSLDGEENDSSIKASDSDRVDIVLSDKTKTERKLSKILSFPKYYSQTDKVNEIVVHLRTIDEITAEINNIIDDFELDKITGEDGKKIKVKVRDDEALREILKNIDDLRVIEDYDKEQMDRTILANTDFQNLIINELYRKVDEEGLVITKDNIYDIIKKIVDDIIARNEFLNDITSTTEELMIEYQWLENWIKENIKDEPKVLSLFESYYGKKEDGKVVTPGLIDGYSLTKELKLGEEVEVFGAVYCLEKNATSEKVFINVRKISEKDELDKIKKDLNENEYENKIDEHENVLASYEIKLLDSKGEILQVSSSKDVLIKVTLPKEYYQKIESCFHTHYKDNDFTKEAEMIENISNFKQTMCGGNFDVYFEVSSFSTFTLTTGCHNVVINTEDDGIGGSVSDIGLTPIVEDKKEFTITVNKSYKAEVYENGSLKTTLAEGSHKYKLDKLLSLDKDLFVEVKFVYVPDKIDGITISTLGHKSYIDGFNNKTFRPNNEITRTEFAKILCSISDTFTLMNSVEYIKYIDSYTDLNKDVWYAPYIGYTIKTGAMIGYKNKFRPNDKVTRAEACKALTKIFAIDEAKVNNIFKDVINTKWYCGSINRMADAGYIEGYGDGTFRPNKNITRAEMVVLINRVRGREINISESEIPQVYKDALQRKFKDVKEGKWYYLDVLEASIDHNIQDFHR